MVLDKEGIVWGILIALMVNGLYDVIFYWLLGKYTEEWAIFVSVVVVFAVTLLLFYKVLFPKKT